MADADFERAFGSLAYAELEQKAPGLFPYLVGFQLVKKTDDETHAIGVFGFKVGEQWYYCPVFWLNGKIKGYDLLYIVSQDIFVPLQESWINYITNRQPYEMGEPLKGTPDQKDFTAPDLTPYTRSPITKQSNVTDDDWCDVSIMHVSPKDARYEKVAAGLDLSNLAQHPELAASLLHTMNGNTKFAEAVYKFYSPNAVFNISQGAKTAAIRKKAAENFITGNNVRVKVQYGTDEMGSGKMTNLSAKEREKLMSGDAVVEDNRKPAETSEIYAKPDFERTLTSPNQSGLWDVLVKGPEFKECLVICDPHTIGKAGVAGRSTSVIPGENKWINATTDSVCARARIDPDKWDSMFKGFGTVQSIKVDDIGLLVNKEFQGTMPFRVTRILKGSDGIINMCVIPFDDVKNKKGESFLSPSKSVSSSGNSCKPVCTGNHVDYDYDAYDCRCQNADNTEYGTKEYYHSCEGHHLCFSPKAGGFVNVNDTLTVNSDSVKFVSLGKFSFKQDREGDWCPDVDEYDIKRGNITLGSAADIDNYLFKVGSMREITIKPDRDETVSIQFRGENKRLLTKNSALQMLIEDIGLREKEARTLVKSGKLAPTHGLVKMGAPMTPSTSGGYDQTYGTVTTSPSQETTRVNSNAPGINRQESMAPIDPEIQQEAEQAAAAGQKDVFDLSVLNGLIRANDIEELLRDLTKDIITGNDRIGRILFLYYWHFDQFSEKYGDEDMKELEDTLRNVFKSAGDLILFLKQKSIEPGSVERASVDIGSAPAAAGI